MSGLARYAKQLGLDVAGYDKTQTALTAQLEKEGISIGFDNDTRHFNQWFDPEKQQGNRSGSNTGCAEQSSDLRTNHHAPIARLKTG